MPYYSHGIYSPKRRLPKTIIKKFNLKRPRFYDKNTRILKSKCDLCNDELPKEADNIQYRINILDEIDDNFESDYDKSTYQQGPKFDIM